MELYENVVCWGCEFGALRVGLRAGSAFAVTQRYLPFNKSVVCGMRVGNW